MSDTPKTDAFEALVNRPMDWWDWARQLERENADLRDALDVVTWADERGVELWRAAHPGKELVIPDRAKLVEWLLEQNAALRKAKEMVELERCEMMRSMSLAQNRSKQLRADKERLDWLTNSLGWIVVGNLNEADPSQHATEDNTLADALRAAIDAARWKEAQP